MVCLRVGRWLFLLRRWDNPAMARCFGLGLRGAATFERRSEPVELGLISVSLAIADHDKSIAFSGVRLIDQLF